MVDIVTVVEKWITADLKVVMADVSVNVAAQEVILMTPTVLAAGTAGVNFGLWTPAGPGVVTPLLGKFYDVDCQAGMTDFALPASPADGFWFVIRDGYAAFASNYCNLVPAVGSGHQVLQTAAPEDVLSIDYPHMGLGFVVVFRAADGVWVW